MAVAFDAATKSAAFGFPDSSPFVFDHAPVGIPRGVLIFCFEDGAGLDPISSVSYGGVELEKLSEVIEVEGEQAIAQAWFVGVSIPSGTQSVSIEFVSLFSCYAVCITVTAAGDCEVVGDIVVLEGDGTLSEQSIDSGEFLALRLAGLISGLASPPAAGASSTVIHTISAAIISTVRESVSGSGNRAVGWSSGTTDDRSAIHLAISDLTTEQSAPSLLVVRSALKF